MAAYYHRRPLTVLRRALAIVGRAAHFSAALLIDARSGGWAPNMPARAAELRELITDLGPAFVKVGACA